MRYKSILGDATAALFMSVMSVLPQIWTLLIVRHSVVRRRLLKFSSMHSMRLVISGLMAQLPVLVM
jgi:hypothetical protein